MLPPEAARGPRAARARRFQARLAHPLWPLKRSEGTVKELVEYVARGLVEHPEQVHVTEVRQGNLTIYELEVAPKDVGKVIGRQGRTINALRAIVKAAAVRRGLRVTVEVV
jgi:predicted RNA-binding protein YlqC (UPF0109 family)